MDITGNTSSDKVYHQVIDYIKQLAKEKEIAFGGRLPSERELMETLGYSRNSIREALRTLEHMGLIECRHGKGNFLVNRMGQSMSSLFSMLIFMNGTDYLEVNHLRRAMEIQAFNLALDRMGEAERDKFAEIMDRTRENDYQSMMQIDHDFHQMLIACSGNRLLVMMMESLSQVCLEEILMVLEYATREYAEWWIKTHRTIYECLMQGEREAGLTALEEHYRWIDEKMEEIMGKEVTTLQC
ncbi:MAG: FadR family transcriptional regulator [Clostridiales bacterium]|nr:FadR family transcriptional regulator [Clostridiales bacterium]